MIKVSTLRKRNLKAKRELLKRIDRLNKQIKEDKKQIKKLK